MSSRVITVVLTLLDFAALIVYNLRAFSFCRSILQVRTINKLAEPASLFINCLLLGAIFYLRLPMLLTFFFIFLVILLQLCMMFQGNILLLLFGSGNFMFHLMDVQMIVTAIYVLVFKIASVEAFYARYPSSVFLCLLLVTLILEVFQRSLDQEALRLLLQNKGQLLFATTSMMLINVYLFILSASYSGQAFSSLAATFLLCTGILLFGAFYTAFQHAVRMSMLLEYRRKSDALEKELEESYEHLDVIQAAASMDTLTEVRNRGYGLEALARMLDERHPGCVCFLDIDHLKAVNDAYGHEEGDRYILRVVQALSEAMADTDTLARLGGDEFLLLLPDRSEAEARALLECVQDALSTAASRYQSSVSYGVTVLDPAKILTASEVLRQADARMYAYKLSLRQELEDVAR